MNVWEKTSSVKSTRADINHNGVLIDETEHAPDGMQDCIYVSWDEWDQIVAAIESRRQEVEG